MINVKDRYSAINMRDECRQPRIQNCISFKKLYETCEVISRNVWTGGRSRVRKLTKPTADALIVSTIANIQVAQLLLTKYNFSYVLPGAFADEAVKKPFGQASQSCGGNFYIDVVNIIKGAAEAKNLNALLKYDSTLQQSDDAACSSNTCFDNDLLNIADTEKLTTCNYTIKHKIFFLLDISNTSFDLLCPCLNLQMSTMMDLIQLFKKIRIEED